jgi:hypothetical protein
MSVGSHSLQADLTTVFGPDNQPYFGGQPVVNTFNAAPGGQSRAAWPNCIWQNGGAASLADAFAKKRQNGCGNAVPNVGFQQAGMTQPSGLITRGSYMYASPTNLTVVQFKVTVDPMFGLSRYASRLYISGCPSLPASAAPTIWRH